MFATLQSYWRSNGSSHIGIIVRATGNPLGSLSNLLPREGKATESHFSASSNDSIVRAILIAPLL